MLTYFLEYIFPEVLSPENTSDENILNENILNDRIDMLEKKLMRTEDDLYELKCKHKKYESKFDEYDIKIDELKSIISTHIQSTKVTEKDRSMFDRFKQHRKRHIDTSNKANHNGVYIF